MIYPKQNRLIFWFFKWYVSRLVGKQFDELLFNAVEVDKNKSVLLIANHFSYWDSLILFWVNERAFKKKPHVMVLEKTMRKEWIIKYSGAFSVSKHSREIIESVNYAAELLNDSGNLVLIFPQGKLYPNFVEQVHFEKGILKIIKQTSASFQLVFAATFVQYFKHKKPKATVYLKTENVNYADKTINDLQEAYQQHYTASKQLQTEIDIEQ
ncbi:MAG: lysophospholipid acyltransferase family protein [Sphingobacteriales bacterium]